MYTGGQNQDGYCLLYYVSDNLISYLNSFIVAHEVIPYCFRSLTDSPLTSDFVFDDTFDSSFTFTELRQKNISSELLLSWSASIDLAERYESFLHNISYATSLLEKEVLFYKCTPLWFGPLCRFAFDLQANMSFDEVITLNFEYRSKIEQVTCYEHLNCTTYEKCLDWREICDRKVDCLDGSDEFNCWELEINECNESEYRCHNGQCIPKEFFHDVPLNPDCLDRTDEPVHKYEEFCFADPAFRCEEQTCRPGKEEFPCGDGQCMYGKNFKCMNGRDKHSSSDLCSTSMFCLYSLSPVDEDWCEEYCMYDDCAKDNCPSLYTFPSDPVLFGHIHFMFKNKPMKMSEKIPLPDYVCYNEKLCADVFSSTVLLNGSTCQQFDQLGLKKTNFYLMKELVENIKDRFRGCLVVPNNCNHSTMYRCFNSTKCISKYRLVDGIRDCPFDDDETYNQSCSLPDVRFRFNCSVHEMNKCFAPLTILDEKNDCENGEEEFIKSNMNSFDNQIYFPRICDGITHLLPIIIDGQNETDETNCEDLWPCNNIYSRCDKIWQCRNGADEINCPPSICPPNEHSCVFPNDTSKISCLPIHRVDDGTIDCLGATDERNYCPLARHAMEFSYKFKCLYDECIDLLQLCNTVPFCLLNDDETFCAELRIDFCNDQYSAGRNEVGTFFCDSFGDVGWSEKYFKILNMPIYSVQLINDNVLLPLLPQSTTQMVHSKLTFTERQSKVGLCNRGLPIYIRQTNDTSRLSCLCPPSYYGDRCQYQNERVSLTLQIRVSSDRHTIYAFLMILIDDVSSVESHEYIEYVPIRDCDTKFNLYLLYSTRPKNQSKNYSVRIDAFNKTTLQYRASWIYPLRFSFLPVHRLAVLLRIPYSKAEPHQRCVQPCVHGQCFIYVNDPHLTFCRCFPGWSGVQCTTEYRCDCAAGSLCMDGSICICPIAKYGPRCHFVDTTCESNACINGGQCVPSDQRYTTAKSTCICPEGYFGDTCEQRQQTRIDISFDEKMSIPPFVVLHLITVQNQSAPTQANLMKRIGFDQKSVTLYTSIVFNVAFIEIVTNYYLIILREQAIVSATVSTQITPSYRCLPITELFNKTLATKHLLKRIKFYHVPCGEQQELVCFYDEKHFCLCDLKRRANCFEFNHQMSYDCGGNNFCENEGKCFEDDLKCPTTSLCACPECYLGSRCQISTSDSTLSLDTILGYQIRPHTHINEQTNAVKVAVTLSTIIFVLGCVSGVLSLMTFQMKKARDVGCGLYLFTSSITSLIIMCLLIVKFWLLFASQTGSITDRLSLNLQCASLDFLLRLSISVSDWLSACVGMERAVTISKGVSFNKVKSKYWAKWMIGIVVLFITSTYIHDPIHRHLADDEEEQRIWCVTQYSPSLRIFDRSVNIFHFSVPFAINCISALIVIVVAARTRSNAQKKQPYQQILREQFQQHKHLLVSPIILVLLGLPRLIISFLSGCMKSARNPWLYLFGYFISFIPPMLTVVVFVLPSEVYKEQLKKSLNRFGHFQLT